MTTQFHIIIVGRFLWFCLRNFH